MLGVLAENAALYWTKKYEDKLDDEFDWEMKKIQYGVENFVDIQSFKRADEKAREGLGMAKLFTYRLLTALNLPSLMASQYYRDLDEKYKNEKSQSSEELRGKFVGFIEQYNKSIEEIVEGQREVTFNPDFKFENGQTVKEKTDEFEGKLRSFINKLKIK